MIAGGRLAGALRVPDAVGPIDVGADLGRRQVETSVLVAAPKEGRASARLNWLLRQLRDAPGDIRLSVSFEGAREVTHGSLAEARGDAKHMLSQVDPKRCPRAFTIALVRPMGAKKGTGRGSFVGDTRQQTFDFYRDLVQPLKPWQPRAPRLKDQELADEVTKADQPPIDGPVSHRSPA